MSHEIDESAGYAAAVFARQPAWHGLGKVLPDVMTGDEAIDAAGLDWQVECRPVYRPNNSGEIIMVEDRRVVVRTDTDAVLGHVGSQYTPLQQREQVDFLNGLLGCGAKIESAGSLRNGKRVWFLADLKATYEVIPGDPVKPYLLTMNSHDATTNWFACLTGIRVVCANTLAVAMEQAGLGRDGRKDKLVDCVKLRHNGRLSENIEQAKLALQIAKTAAEKQAEQAKALVQIKMLTSDLAQFFAEQVQQLKFTKERSELILQDLALNLDAPTNALPGMRGTAWQAFNVWSEWLDHAPRRTGADVRMESIWMGDASKRKTKAWETLLQNAV